jgi:beta-mannosidase
MRFGVEFFRRSPLCQGSLIWQFNDCWPAQSWALEDHGGLLKPAGHELARTYASIMLSVFVVAGQAQIWAINDSDKEVSRIVEVDIVDVFSGTREPERLPIILEPGEKRQIRGLSIAEKDPKRTALCARFVDLPSSARWEFLAPPKEMMLMEPQVSVSQEGLELIVKVQGFAADLIIWDDENATNLLSPISGWPGWSAMTLLDEEVSLRFNSSPNHLRAKSLIGNHDIHVH